MENKKLKVGAFLKMLMVRSNLEVKEVAQKLDKTPQNINAILRNNRMNLGTLIGIMEICEEPLLLKLSSGEVIELEITDKKLKNERTK